MVDQLALLPGYLLAHLQLVVAALLVGTAVSVPLGVLATRLPRLGGAIVGLASVVQTVPGLALLAAMVPALAWVGLPSIGYLPAFLALVLYSALPILRNTVTGIHGVDPALTEAARGLGMTDAQQLWRVELPLALPVILAGVRTATVWTVGAATLSTPVGATSLGNYIFSGLQTRNHAAILVGCAAAAGLAIALDGLVRRISSVRRAVVASIAASLMLVLALPPTGHHPVVIGAKTFTEQYVLAAILDQQIAKTGAQTEIRASLGSTVAFDALRAGDIDVYVDYSGTIWATVLGHAGKADRAEVLSTVTDELAARGVIVAASLGFENTYALAVPRSRAESLGLRTIGDLASYPGWTLGADYEFFSRPEWASIRDTYLLTLKQRTMDPSLLYEACGRDVDVVTAYSTDGRIAAYDLAVLADDRSAIPPYDAIVLVNAETARRRPEVVEALRHLDGTIDAVEMRRMNAEVDRDGRSPGDVARGR